MFKFYNYTEVEKGHFDSALLRNGWYTVAETECNDFVEIVEGIFQNYDAPAVLAYAEFYDLPIYRYVDGEYVDVTEKVRYMATHDTKRKAVIEW